MVPDRGDTLDSVDKIDDQVDRYDYQGGNGDVPSGSCGPTLSLVSTRLVGASDLGR